MITFHFKSKEEADSFGEFLDKLCDNPELDFDEFFNAKKQS